MNNKDLNELFDIEAALLEFEASWSKEFTVTPSDVVISVLKAATAGREYQLVPKVRDWLSGEEMPEVPFWCLANSVIVTVEERNELSGCLCRFMDGSIDIIHSSNLKPIPPKPKKIDHSSLEKASNWLDYVYEMPNGDMLISDNYHYQFDNPSVKFCGLRLGEPKFLKKAIVSMIPKGYEYEIEQPEGGNYRKLVTITGIKEGWEL